MSAAEAQAELLAKLHKDTRIPPAELVGKLQKHYTDKKGVDRYLELDYLGHAAVTDLLLDHDPAWAWEPVAWDDHGQPMVIRDKEGWARGLWIRLTVHGHTRLGFGSCAPNKPDAVKELIGDALRNAGMRFGLGLSLWAKEEWQDEGVSEAGNEDRPGERTPKENRGSAPKDNAPRTGKTTKPNDGSLLRQDQAIAARAQALGLDDPTRIDVIRAITGKTSGKDLEPNEVTQVMRNLQWLVDGFVQLKYDGDGAPSIVDTHPPNPGPPDSSPPLEPDAVARTIARAAGDLETRLERLETWQSDELKDWRRSQGLARPVGTFDAAERTRLAGELDRRGWATTSDAAPGPPEVAKHDNAANLDQYSDEPF